jgi:hypothetical protein
MNLQFLYMYDGYYYGYTTVKVIDLGIRMIFITMRSGNSWQGFVLLTTVEHGYGMPQTSGERCLMPGLWVFFIFTIPGIEVFRTTTMGLGKWLFLLCY